MALEGICRRIEADFHRHAGPIREGLAGFDAEPTQLTGIGVLATPQGHEYIEIRVAPATDVRALAAAVARRYGLPVNVVHVVAAPSAQAQYSIRAGDAVGHADCGRLGTAGAFLLDRQGGGHLILSNAHVLALDGQGEAGDWIVDGRGNEIAQLYRTTTFAPGRYHDADAALAILVDGVRPAPTGYLAPTQAVRGTLVRKRGARTGDTVGRIASVDYSISVEFATGTIWFKHQIVIEPVGGHYFSQGGDSGALIRGLHDPAAACGLLFAGDEGGPWPRRTYANHLAAVMRGLQLAL